MPVWHVSVSLGNGNTPKPFVAWTSSQLAKARALAREMLRGVGVAPDKEAPGTFVLHFMNDDKERQVDFCWDVYEEYLRPGVYDDRYYEYLYARPRLTERASPVKLS